MTRKAGGLVSRSLWSKHSNYVRFTNCCEINRIYFRYRGLCIINTNLSTFCLWLELSVIHGLELSCDFNWLFMLGGIMLLYIHGHRSNQNVFREGKGRGCNKQGHSQRAIGQCENALWMWNIVIFNKSNVTSLQWSLVSTQFIDRTQLRWTFTLKILWGKELKYKA